MVTDHQVRRLKRMLSQGKKLSASALKTEMDEKTARKYRDLGKLKSRIELEKKMLRALPEKKIDASKELMPTVSRNSTIMVNHNVYLVDSCLMGETVKVRMCAEHLEVWYAQKLVERIPRLRGEGKHRIQYRHIIDSLLRKPGALHNYKYKQDLFPTTRFRMVYDGLLRGRTARNAAKEYLLILNPAAKESESLVDEAIRILIQSGKQIIDSTAVEQVFNQLKAENRPVDVHIHIPPADPTVYDQLFVNREASWIVAK